MGQARTINPYKKGSRNYARVQKEIASTKKTTTPVKTTSSSGVNITKSKTFYRADGSKGRTITVGTGGYTRGTTTKTNKELEQQASEKGILVIKDVKTGEIQNREEILKATAPKRRVTGGSDFGMSTGIEKIEYDPKTGRVAPTKTITRFTPEGKAVRVTRKVSETQAQRTELELQGYSPQESKDIVEGRGGQTRVTQPDPFSYFEARFATRDARTKEEAIQKLSRLQKQKETQALAKNIFGLQQTQRILEETKQETPSFQTGQPRGKKVKIETPASIASQGYFGTAIGSLAQEFSPYDEKGFRFEKLPAYTGLKILETPTRLGEGLGVYFGGKAGQEFVTKTGVQRVISVEEYQKGLESGGQEFFRDPLGFGGAVAVGAATGIVSEARTDPIGLGASFVAFSALGKGVSTIGKGLGKIRFVGKQLVPAKQLVTPSVLKGAKAFPEVKGSAKELLRVYGQEGYFRGLGAKKGVFSATDYPFLPFKRSLTVTTGRGLVKGADVPGVYTSTRGIATYFLRLKGQTAKYSILPGKPSLFRGPKVLFIEKAPARIPSTFRTSVAKAQSYFGKVPETIKAAKQGLSQKQLTKLVEPYTKGKPGKPYVSPAFEFGLKKEAEAVIQVGTKFKRAGLSSAWQKLTGFKEYTVVGGKKIPILRLEQTATKSVKGFGKISKKFVSQSLPSSASYSVSSVSKPLLSYSRLGFIGSKLATSYVPKTKSYVEPKYSSKNYVIPSYKSPILSSKKIVSSFKEPKPSVVKSFKEPTYSSSVSSLDSSVSLTSSGVPITSTYVPKPIPSYRVGGPTKTPSSTIVKRKRVKEERDERVYATGTFHAYVRRNNNRKWVKVTKNPKPYNMAFNRGLMVADNTTARTVKLKRAGKTSVGVDDPFIYSQKFRRRKTGSKVPGKEVQFVEKQKFLIDTIGEKQGLKAAKYMKQRGGGLPWGF